MGQPKKAAAASKKTYNTRASNRSRSPEDRNHVSKIATKKSTTLKENGSIVTGHKLKVHKARPGKSIDDDADSNCDENISENGFSYLLANYVGPIDDESARKRMADALFIWNWNLLGYYAKDRSSNKVSLIEPVASRSPSSPSIASPVPKNAAIGSEESAGLPSKLVGTDENNTMLAGNEDGEVERPGNNETTHPPPASTSSLSSVESSDLTGLDDLRPKSQKAVAKTDKKGPTAASAAPSKLPRGKACARCKSRKLKCGIGATCTPCAQAGVSCSRPPQ